MNADSYKLTSSKEKTFLTIGFITIIILIIVLITLWFKSISDNKNLLMELSDETVEIQYISRLIDTIHQRTLVLNSMEKEESIIILNSSYQDFIQLGIIFRETNNILRTSLMENDERNVWNTIEILNMKFDQLENNAQKLYLKGKKEEAFRYLISIMPSLQLEISSEASRLLNDELLNMASNEIIKIIAQSSKKNEYSYFLVFFLVTLTIFFVIFSLIILKRDRMSEKSHLMQSNRIRSLYEATSVSGLSLDDRITETLKLGCRVLNMEIGKLGSQDPDKNASLFLNTVAPAELPAKRGLVLPLDKTFCNITFSSSGPIAIHHVSNSIYRDHPAAEFLGMEAYIGTTIYVNDVKFGTVNFSNRKPLKEPFTKTDTDFVNLLGKWISITMEQMIVEKELQQSKERAESANQAKTTFLANMSHEIRTPLNAILGYSEMLKDKEQTQEEIDHEIDSIIKSGTHLQNIINDILDLSKIEAGQLIIENIALSPMEFMSDIEAIMSEQANEKNLYFNINYQNPIPDTIFTDPTRLKQILINVCSNAIKFTQQGGLNISMKYRSTDEILQISVKDTGIGMSESDQEHIFKAFTQADDSTTRLYGGTGLGLCISKELAKKLGGDITVKSEKDNGSLFTITINGKIKA